jgi:hypothetical protein
MQRYSTLSTAHGGHNEQVFYEAFGDDSPGFAALKLMGAIPLSFILYAGVVAVIACLLAYGNTGDACDLGRLMHCTIAG